MGKLLSSVLTFSFLVFFLIYPNSGQADACDECRHKIDTVTNECDSVCGITTPIAAVRSPLAADSNCTPGLDGYWQTGGGPPGGDYPWIPCPTGTQGAADISNTPASAPPPGAPKANSPASTDPKNAEADKIKGMMEECRSAHSSAQTQCGSRSTGAVIGQTLVQGASALTSTAFDAKSMCTAQTKQAIASLLATAIAGTGCLLAAGNCTRLCDMNNLAEDSTWGKTAWDDITGQQIKAAGAYKSQCTTMKYTVGAAATLTGTQIWQAKANAATCERNLAALTPPPYLGCNDPNAAQDPTCPQYCAAHPGSPLPQCNMVAQGTCSIPSVAQDTRGCPLYCTYHQADPTCQKQGIPNTAGTTTLPDTHGPIGSDTGGQAPPSTGDEINGGQYTGNPPGPKNGSNTGPGNDNSSGGGAGLAGGGAPGGGAGGSGNPNAAASGLNKDIEHGLTSGSGGGFSVSGVPLGGGGGANPFGANGRGGPGSDKLDLSQFLPGGKNDPNANRGPAGLDLTAQGISAANGLSNFEKVSRMMRIKEPSLIPGLGK